MGKHESVSSREKVPLLRALGKIWRTDIKYLCLVMMYFGVTFKVINTIIPVEAWQYLHWKSPLVAAVCMANVVLGTFLYAMISYFSERLNYEYTLLIGVISSMLSIGFLMVIPDHRIGTTALSAIFFLMSLLNVCSSCLIGISSVVISRETTIPYLVSLTNGIRIICMELSYFIGALLIPAAHMSLKISGCVGLSLCCLCVIVLFLVKRRSLST